MQAVTDADAGLLFDAVREAGALAATLFRQSVRGWSKYDGSPVSEADMKVDALLAGRLCSARPGYGWLSEETADDGSRVSRSCCWIVDPIDGTRSFLKHEDNWCVAAALAIAGRPVIAAVYRPMRAEFFSAVEGGGALLNGQPINASHHGGIDGARIMGSRQAMNALTGCGAIDAPAGDTPLQLRLALVASGGLDGAVSAGNKNDWDLAAGDLLVHEAGGTISDLAGRRLFYNQPCAWQKGMAAAAPAVHRGIMEALTRK